MRLTHAQTSLLTAVDRDQRKRLMTALGDINARFGRHTLVPAAAGLQRSWSTKFDRKSPCYTTRWKDHFTSNGLILLEVSDPKLLSPAPQDGFRVGITFQSLHHGAHLVLDLVARFFMLPATKRLALSLQVLPALHEALRPHMWISLRHPFPLHAGNERADAIAAGTLSHDIPRPRIMLQGRPDQLVRSRTCLFELLPCPLQLLLLHFEKRQALIELLAGSAERTCIPINGLFKAGHGPYPLGKPIRLFFPRALALRDPAANAGCCTADWELEAGK